MTILPTTLAARFEPGSNLKDGAAGAAWSFLLPSLELGHVLCLGEPPETSLATLARLARALTVCTDDRRARDRLAAVADRQGWREVRIADLDAAGRLAAGSVDLAWPLTGGYRLHGERLAAFLSPLLSREGLVYLEGRGPRSWRLDGAFLGALGRRGAESLLLRLSPAAGEVRSAIPLGDRATARHLVRRDLAGPLVAAPFGRVGRRLLERAPARGVLDSLAERIVPRAGAIVATHPDPDGALAAGPPRYLRRIAAEAGIDLRGARWGLSARGRYNSQKVLFVLLGGVEGLVKMTRTPDLGPRLANESAALGKLAALGVIGAERAPRLLFHGRHAGLEVVGESLAGGTPFRKRSRWTADCPYLADAVEWLAELGAASVQWAEPNRVAAALGALLERFSATYRPAATEEAFLAAQVQAIAAADTPFPLVFQHGDPGTWNLVVRPDGRVAFLDWEAAEPLGMPLWDLFYLLRSFAVSGARAGRIGDPLEAYARRVLAEAPLGRLLVDAVGRHCQRIGIARRYVEPLFHLCWMHRALKEATRLEPAALGQGHYLRLLHLGMARRQAPTLARLFTGRAEGTPRPAGAPAA